MDTSVTLWIYLPLVIILISNIIFFEVYQLANPTLQLWLQLWNYLGSDIFKALTVSLLFPIFLFLFERRFKILERREEEKKQREEEKKQRQIEAFKKSTQMWNEFDNMINQIVFFDIFHNNIRIREVLLKLENSSVTVVGIIYSWRFLSLTDQDIQHLSDISNFLYFAAKSVGGYICKNNIEDNRAEILHLQECLRVIENIIGRILHINGISLLTLMIKLGDSNMDKNERGQTEKRILSVRQSLQYWATFCKTEEIAHNNLIAGYNSPNTLAFREAADALRRQMLDYKLTDIKSPKLGEEYRNFNELYNQLPVEEKLSVEKFAFSKEFITYLGEKLASKSVTGYFLSRIETERAMNAQDKN